jgi:photosystem II stability/assembly factor-like uncharacterized protein
MAKILVGTAAGLLSFDAAGTVGVPQLQRHDVRGLAPESWTRLWAIVDRREVWRTDNGGEWNRVVTLDYLHAKDHLEALCLADTRANAEGGILIGTSRARLLRVTERQSLEVVEGFDRAPGRNLWSTPWGGPPDTRSITEDSKNVFVNIHVGGVLRSRDRGMTWQPTIDVDADVHRVVAGHGRVYAAGAHGLSVSHDEGETWRLSAAGLHASYCRSVAVCGPFVLLSASTGPRGGRAALYRSSSNGDAFERCREGLPEWFAGNLDSLCLDALPDGSLAAFGTEAGEVYASTDQGTSWARVADGLKSIRCVLALP